MSLSLIQQRIQHHGYEKVYEYISRCPEVLTDWQEIARPEQLPPDGDWQYWMIKAGRGFGKTRSGAEWVKAKVNNGYKRIALVGATAADVRDIMVEGEAGILSLYDDDPPEYIPSKRQLQWSNGAKAYTYSAEEPKRLRGPSHDAAWADELAAWKYATASWDQLMFGLRLGVNPQCCVTTTPRPIKVIKDLIKDSGSVVTVGSTYDNKANLAPQFYSKIIQKYEGTRLGRQEIHAEILDDNPDSVFSRNDIDTYRLDSVPEEIQLVMVHVGVDPAVTSGDDADDTGIVVAGRDSRNPPHFYVLGDHTCHKSPMGWAAAAVYSYHNYEANKIVGETNNGGELVRTVIHTVDPSVRFEAVHASRGKVTRAEPVGALYEQGRVHHIGTLPKLEDEMCNWSPDMGESPDRMDALVWAITSLTITGRIFAG